MATNIALSLICGGILAGLYVILFTSSTLATLQHTSIHQRWLPFWFFLGSFFRLSILACGIITTVRTVPNINLHLVLVAFLCTYITLGLLIPRKIAP